MQYLVELDRLLLSACLDCVQQSECSHPGHLRRVLRHLEGDLDVGLGRKVVDLVRLNFGNDLDLEKG